MKKLAFVCIVSCWAILGFSKQLFSNSKIVNGKSNITLNAVGNLGLWIANETGGGQYWTTGLSAAGGAAGWMAGAWAGGKIGAMFGSVGGPAGTVIGTLVGATGGAL